jgi:Zn-dependent protease
MSVRPHEPELERRLANLEAVARHHAAGGASEPGHASAPASGASSAWRRRLAGWGPVGLVLLFVLGKAKLLVPLLKVTKLSTLVTMLLTVGIYAQLWGLAFAVGFVLLIFVHELGHALVMRQQGIPAGAPVFIPFVGAVIAMKGRPRDAWVEALVGIGGPLLGSAGALACLAAGWATGSLFWHALAYTGFMINLFNLIPISPLDGGRIVGVISRWLWVAGYVVGIAVFLATRSPILLLVLLLGLLGLRGTIRGPRAGYFEVEPRRRWAMAAAYFGLLASLSIGMRVAEGPLAELRAGTGAGRDHASSISSATPRATIAPSLRTAPRRASSS